jgi:hypothetical protein
VPIFVQAIVARDEVIGTEGLERAIDDELGARNFAGNMIRDMSDYPAQLPTVSGYIRTGEYGRGWRIRRRIRQRNRRGIEVANRIPYSTFVGGPRRGPTGLRQTREMRRRRWTSIDTAVRRHWDRRTQPRIVRILTQRSPAVRRRRLRRR